MKLSHINKSLLLIVSMVLSAVPLSADEEQNRQIAELSRAQTKVAERKLADLGYWTGPIDGVLDTATQTALIAFQKWEGRSLTGRLTVEEFEAIQKSDTPTPRDPGYAHVEVDIDRQLLLIVDENGAIKVVPVSTGSGKEFVDDGQTSVAYTPRGRFIVYDKIAGWENGPIGRMFYPNYISGGVAIHGSKNVPTQPETHGCIRVPLFAARKISKLLKVGTIVLVYDKVSFVSAKSWAENPKLKEAADRVANAN
jgi:peptidoglycan hydrolase-like protein with peptidoglycan-binding domain